MNKKYVAISINFIAYIVLIAIIINLLIDRKFIAKKEIELIKQMPETEQVTNLQKQLDTLNLTQTAYANYIQNCKTQIATAITNEGIETSNEEKLETMAENISKILQARTTDATATAEQILSGQTAYANGSKITGTMVNNGAVEPAALNSGESYTIPEGYHNGSGKVTVAALSGQTEGTATAEQILTGQTAYVNGNKITGTMPAYTSGSQAITTSGKWGLDTTYGAWTYIPSNGYYSTGHWTNIPWNTIKGNLGTTTAGNVLEGQTFSSSSGLKQTGTMVNRGALNWNPSTSTSYTVPAGYYSGGTISTSNAWNAATQASTPTIVNLGSYITNTTIDIKSKCSKYASLTNSNFVGAFNVNVTAQCTDQGNVSGNLVRSLSYNSSTGILTVTCNIKTTVTHGTNHLYMSSAGTSPIYLIY